MSCARLNQRDVVQRIRKRAQKGAGTAGLSITELKSDSRPAAERDADSHCAAQRTGSANPEGERPGWNEQVRHRTNPLWWTGSEGSRKQSIIPSVGTALLRRA
jgi:hypothetical protein